MNNIQGKQYRKSLERLSNCQAIYTFDKMVGIDENFINTVEYAKKISNNRSTVLITGESGTGKEIFAQSIHNYSSRRNKHFIAVNCGAMPSNLIESELFGYEEGAFTGAKKGGNIGKFEAADGGSIFLDEIGEMDLKMQIRLLRVIEEGVISKIGSSKQIPINVRIIAATNKDLEEEVKKGKFRMDLFYRLNVFPIYLPTLRDRKDDIPILIDYYMNKICKKENKYKKKIDENLMQKFMQYEWPGNIRELQNIVERIINTENIPKEILKKHKFDLIIKSNNSKNFIKLEDMKLQTVEKNHIIKVIKYFSGNISLAADALGIGRTTLYSKIKKYNINCSDLEF